MKQQKLHFFSLFKLVSLDHICSQNIFKYYLQYTLKNTDTEENQDHKMVEMSRA